MKNIKKNLLTAIFVISAPLAALAGTYDDLIHGAKMGDTQKIRQLAAKGASLDTTDPDGNTLLMLAARDDHLQLVNFLIANRVKLNARNAAGDTALGLAALRGHRNSVQALIAAGAAQNIPGWPPLVYAAFSGHAEIVNDLLSSPGASLDSASDHGMTALMAAARNGHINVVRILLKAGANPNQQTDAGETALDLALKFRNTDIGELLRSAGGKTGQEARAPAN